MSAHPESHAKPEAHAATVHKEDAAHNEVANAHPSKRWHWFENLLKKIPHPTKEDFKFGNLLQKSKWATVGGMALAWLHSSILLPALTLGAGIQFFLNHYVAKPAGAGAGHH